jgi:hypothetical protein
LSIVPTICRSRDKPMQTKKEAAGEGGFFRTSHMECVT